MRNWKENPATVIVNSTAFGSRNAGRVSRVRGTSARLSAKPRRSPGASGVSSRTANAATRTATPSGTLTRNTHRHDASSVSRPPATTPIEAPAEPDEGDQREGPPPSRLVDVQPGDHAEHDRRGERAADALGDPGGHQAGRARGEAAQGGRGGEEHQPGHEDLAGAHQITEPTGRQQQQREGDEEAVDHPGQPRVGEAQVGPDRRQRDVHDRAVEDHHQLGHQQDHQGPALDVGRCRCGSSA